MSNRSTWVAQIRRPSWDTRLLQFVMMLLMMVPLVKAEENPFFKLHNWIEGFGDAEYDREAKKAEKLFCAGKKLPPNVTPAERAIREANRLKLKCTIKALETKIKKHKVQESSQLPSFSLTACDPKFRVHKVLEGFELQACARYYDGTLYHDGIEIYKWANGQIRAKGGVGAWGRHGRWLFFNQQGKKSGHQDYYRGNIISTDGKIHKVSRPQISK